jgi:hypothetical protein
MSINEDKVSEIAAIVARSLSTTCCFTTKGSGNSPKYSVCECRYVAQLILEKLGVQ